MISPINQPLRNRTFHVCLAVALLSLVPHLAKSFDATDGLRVGLNAYTNALSSESVMVGLHNSNPSPYSAAIGYMNNLGGSSYGYGSIAVGMYNTQGGYLNYSFGYGNVTQASYGTAIGAHNTIRGLTSLAYGTSNQTGWDGYNALAGGSNTIAYASSSVALGNYTTALSYASMIIGQHNAVVGGDAEVGARYSWRPGDALFVIGNGTSPSTPSNALEVKKDGSIKMQRQGDILMGDFTAP